jgi:DNA polymerase III sliding clamp (beta) subunit (PCNA family)
LEHLLALAPDRADCIVDGTGKGLSLRGSAFQIDALGLDGKYPSYSELIPTEAATSCTVAVDELLRRLVAVAMFAPDDLKRVTLQFRSNHGLAIRGEAPDRGTGHATLSVAMVGVDTDVTVNPAYVEAALRVIGSERVALQVSSEHRILVMRPSPAFDYVYIVMPLVS